jgi:hypothetical protein
MNPTSGVHRRWRIVFFKRQLLPDGRVADVEIAVFENAEPLTPTGGVRDIHGRVVFRTAEGKEVVAGGVAYLAKEV